MGSHRERASTQDTIEAGADRNGRDWGGLLRNGRDWRGLMPLGRGQDRVRDAGLNRVCHLEFEKIRIPQYVD